MKGNMLAALVASGLMVSTTAIAATTVDFGATVSGYVVDGSGTPRLQGLATFTAVGLKQTGTFTIEYFVYDQCDNVRLFDTYATIMYGEKKTVTGDASTAQVTLTYKKRSDQIVAEFDVAFSPLNSCDMIIANAAVPGENWHGEATLSSSDDF